MVYGVASTGKERYGARLRQMQHLETRTRLEMNDESLQEEKGLGAVTTTKMFQR